MMYYLSEADLAVIKRLLERHRGSRRNTTNRPAGAPGLDVVHELAPEVYVSRTPTGGIPGLDAGSSTGTGTGTDLADLLGDAPGYADGMMLWRLTDKDATLPTLEPYDGFTRRVFNLSTTAIDGDKWVLVVRDKDGTWWVDDPDPGGSAAAGTIDVCGVPPNSDTGTGTGTPGPGDCPAEETTPFLIQDPLLLKFSEDFELFELAAGDCESSSGTGTGSGVHGDERKTAYLRTRGLTGEFATGIIDFRICTDCSVLKQYRVVCVKRGRVQRFFLDPPELPQCPT